MDKFTPMYDGDQELTEQQQFAINTVKNLQILTQYLVNSSDWQTLDSLKEVMENVLTAAYSCQKQGKKFGIADDDTLAP